VVQALPAGQDPVQVQVRARVTGTMTACASFSQLTRYVWVYDIQLTLPPTILEYTHLDALGSVLLVSAENGTVAPWTG
jgi:hypothetical protein